MTMILTNTSSKILTQDVLSEILAFRPARVIPMVIINDLVDEINSVKYDWMANGVPLEQIAIPVSQMFEEFFSILQTVTGFNQDIPF